jgi:hypothetical protein
MNELLCYELITSRWSEGKQKDWDYSKRIEIQFIIVPLITCHALILLWNCLKLCVCVLHREVNIWDKFETEI